MHKHLMNGRKTDGNILIKAGSVFFIGEFAWTDLAEFKMKFNLNPEMKAKLLETEIKLVLASKKEFFNTNTIVLGPEKWNFQVFMKQNIDSLLKKQVRVDLTYACDEKLFKLENRANLKMKFGTVSLQVEEDNTGGETL